MKYISPEKLIQQAKKEGVDFGKGDPYNRLRYYTKIGWLPHMVRKKGAKGHYPTWALKRLLFIEKLKDLGISNDEITKKINRKNKLRPIYNLIKTPETKFKLTIYIIVILLGVVFASELGIINLGTPKNRFITQKETLIPKEIIESGTAFVLKNRKEAFIKTNEVRETHKIYISFNNNITPAIRFWVSKKVPFEGFYVELDAPVSNDVEFNWWITN